MSAIKKFFEKKKLNSKFKLAGAGQQLNAPSTKTAPAPSRPAERCPSSQAGAQAAQAALARFQVQQSQSSKLPTSSAATWKQKSDMQASSSKEIDMPQFSVVENTVKEKKKVHVEDGVIFSCPVCPISLPREDIFVHLKQCLMNELDAEPLMISVTMIHTLNRDKQKVENCVTILGKYLQNIIDNPDEEKYRKIRKTNKVFQEKVANLDGTEEFLRKGCGFELQTIPFEVGGETSEHEFYVLGENLAHDTEQLIVTKQMLSDAEPLDICIDRNIKVFKPSPAAANIEVPASFYEIVADDVKQRQLERTSEVEKSKQLRTKAMRDGDTASKRIYKYCIIRIRLPDGVLFQGSFSSAEKLVDLKQFVQECLSMDWLPFSLVDSIGRPYLDESATLMKLKLCPASLVNLNIEPNIAEEIAASSPGGKVQYLREEYLALMQNLP